MRFKSDIEEFDIVYHKARVVEYDVDDNFKPTKGRKAPSGVVHSGYNIYSRYIGQRRWELYSSVDTDTEVKNVIESLGLKKVKTKK